MEALEDNTEPYELKSFSRKLYSDDHIKDRMIMRHLKRRKNNSLLDFDKPTKVQKMLGHAMNKDILLSSPGVGTYLVLSFVAILAASIIIYLNT